MPRRGGGVAGGLTRYRASAPALPFRGGPARLDGLPSSRSGWGLSTVRYADRPHPNPSPEGEGLRTTHLRDTALFAPLRLCVRHFSLSYTPAPCHPPRSALCNRLFRPRPANLSLSSQKIQRIQFH